MKESELTFDFNHLTWLKEEKKVCNNFEKQTFFLSFILYYKDILYNSMYNLNCKIY